MSKDLLYLRHWITREGYGPDTPPGRVILECIPSRAGMSLGVYDRGKRIFTINGCGFDRIGTTLGEFLETCFMPELKNLAASGFTGSHHVAGAAFRAINMAQPWEPDDWRVSLEGATGYESMAAIAEAIGLKVHRAESKAGTLIIIEKGN